MSETELELKQKQFNTAMELYDNGKGYRIFGRLVSIVNISLQIYLVFLIFPLSIGLPKQILSLLAAYIIADFLNGLVHMYMDNNEDYTSIAGPLIASFHLHHRTPLYKNNSVPVVYFNETGSKVWLVFYLLAVLVLIKSGNISPVGLYVLVYVGILSSVAEVSHYLAHNKHSGSVEVLRRTGLLLSSKYHAQHHMKDNVSYTFLNGFTDPLVNIISEKYFKGYKNTTDRHYERYTGPGTENRAGTQL